MSERVRVLVLTPDFPPARGGIQVLSHRIVTGFERVEPTVVTLSHPAAPAFDQAQPFRVARVGGRLGGRAPAIAALNLLALDVARRVRPHVVLSAHIVVSPPAALLRRWQGLPWVQYVHAKEVGTRPGLARFALSRADSTIAVSDYACSLARDAHAPPARVHRIHPGVDLGAPPPSPRRPQTRPTIVTIARLEDRYKGHDVMLRALPLVRAQVPDVLWAVIGEGPLRSLLEQRASALGLDGCVRFLGGVDDAARDAWLERAHVFAMVSRLPARGFAGEGFGIVYLEANARGLPVVAGAAGGAVDAVVDGETGLLVDPEDHVAVARALTRLLTDPELSERLGTAGRERAQSFAWPRVAREVEQLLLDVCA